MKDLTIGGTRRRTVVAAVAALGLTLAPAAVTPPGAHAMPSQGVRGCRPGSIKTVGGKKYVCNIHGKWVRVLNLTSVTSRTHATASIGVLR